MKKKLEETPDKVIIRDKNGKLKSSMIFLDSEAYPFAYLSDKTMHIGRAKSMHMSFPEKNFSKLMYPGRLFKKHKIISFWIFPPKNEFKKLLKDIEKASGGKIKFDSSWKIEVILDKDNNIKYAKSEEDWQNKKTITIPIDDYSGSLKRPSQELIYRHMLSPLFKKDNVKNMKNVKLPKGMSQAEYNHLINKYSFTEEIKRIVESPDQIEVDGKKHLFNKDCITFGYVDGEMYTMRGETHGDLAQVNCLATVFDRGGFKYPGRVFLKPKVITFWKFPPRSRLKKLLKDIEKKDGKVKFNNNWKIEVLVDKGGNIDYKEKYMYSNNKNVAYVPINDYIGSVGRSSKEMVIQHLIPPILKKGGKSMKNIKLPSGMSQAEFNDIKTKYKFQEEVERIIENPDRLKDGNKEYAFNDSDAYPFGYYGKKMCVGEKREKHNDIETSPGKWGRDRFTFTYPGRIFLKPKIITFWNYPPKSKFNKVLKDIEKASDGKIKFDSKWRIEVILDKDKSIKYIKNKDWDNSNYTKINIPVGEYAGSRARSSEEMTIQHLIPPILKKGGKNMKNVNLPKGMTQAEFNNLISKYKFTEGIERIVESPDEVVYFDDKGNKVKLKWFSGRAFGYFGDQLYVSNIRETHMNLIHSLKPRAEELGLTLMGLIFMDRHDMQYPGRLWEKEKIITFWKYPDRQMLKTIIKDIRKVANINIDNSWKIEVCKGLLKPSERNPKWNFEGVSCLVVPINEFLGSEDRKANDMIIQHMLSPLLKTANSVYKKIQKTPKDMSIAQYKNMKTKYKFTEERAERFILKNDINKYINERTTSQLNGLEVDDGPATWFKDFNHYKKTADEMAEKVGFQVISYLVIGKGSYDNVDDFTKAIPVSYFPAGVKGEITATNAIDWKGTKAYNAWAKRIKDIAQIMGWKFVEFMSAEDKEEIINQSLKECMKSYGTMLAMGILKEEKIKDFIDDYTLNFDEKFVTYNKNPKIKIYKDDVKYLNKNLNVLEKTKTKTIQTKHMKLGPYDNNTKTIGWNDEIVNINVLKQILKIIKSKM